MIKKLEADIIKTDLMIRNFMNQLDDIELDMGAADSYSDDYAIHELKCSRAKCRTKLDYLGKLLAAHKNELQNYRNGTN
jgi:hypothetical protein